MFLHQIIKKLKENNVEEVIAFMEEYDISPDLLKEHLIELQFNPSKQDLMKDVGN